MYIRITVYKESGKYYTHEDVRCEKDIPLYSEEFKRFIVDNIPADLKCGFIVITDVGSLDEQTFHNELYQYKELF